MVTAVIVDTAVMADTAAVAVTEGMAVTAAMEDMVGMAETEDLTRTTVTIILAIKADSTLVTDIMIGNLMAIFTIVELLPV